MSGSASAGRSGGGAVHALWTSCTIHPASAPLCHFRFSAPRRQLAVDGQEARGAESRGAGLALQNANGAAAAVRRSGHRPWAFQRQRSAMGQWAEVARIAARGCPSGRLLTGAIALCDTDHTLSKSLRRGVTHCTAVGSDRRPTAVTVASGSGGGDARGAEDEGASGADVSRSPQCTGDRTHFGRAVGRLVLGGPQRAIGSVATGPEQSVAESGGRRPRRWKVGLPPR
jgi:hypothetical protein